MQDFPDGRLEKEAGPVSLFCAKFAYSQHTVNCGRRQKADVFEQAAQ
jgi:hypothetical protein